MRTPPIDEWAEDERGGFYVDRHYIDGRWRRRSGPIRLAEHHRRILRHCFTPREDGRLPYSSVCLCEPAKSGKSTLAALVHQYFMLHLEPGSEQYIISNKRDQARDRCFKSLTESIRLNRHIRIQPGRYDLTARNGTEVKAIPCNARTEAGARYSLASFDEPWAIVYEGGARLVSEFKPDPTRDISVRLFTGVAGYDDSDLWRDLLERGKAGEPVPELEDLDDGEGSPAAWHNGSVFAWWSHRPRMLWQTPEWLATMAEELPVSEVERQVWTHFVEGVQEFFVRPEWWAACQSNLPALERGEPVVAAYDLASGTVGGDTVSIVAVSPYRDGHAVRYAQRFEPPADGSRFDYDTTIKTALHWLAEHYNLVQVCYDPYQSVHLANELREELPAWYKEFPQGTERERGDKHLYDAIVAGQVYHDGDEALTEHVTNAGAKKTGTDHMRIVKRHWKKKIDLCVCLSMAVWRASQLSLPNRHPAQPATEYQAWSEQRRQDVLSRMGMTLAERELAEGRERRLAEIPPEPEPQPANGTIKAEYIGMLAEGSFKILTTEGLRPVFRGTHYELPAEIWHNITNRAQTLNLRPEWRQVP